MKNLLAIVERSARDEGADRVRLVHLRIGELAGVSADALRFAFEVMSKGTAAEGGTLEIEHVPLGVRCAGCGKTSTPRDFVFRCPACGSTEIEIVTGREMEVDYIEAGDDEAEGPGPACG
jgi:hydrogenase nickel incorporation protein HypA/HybF